MGGAMRGFLRKTALFSLLVLLALLAGELAMRRVPNVYAYKNHWMLAHSSRLTTLILGNSVSLEGIDPALLGEGAFNLAMSAQTLEQDRYLLEHYAPYPQLKTVILPLTENLFSPELEATPSLSVRVAYYQIYMGWNKHGPLSKFNYELSNLNACRAKREAYRQLRAEGKELACDSLGYAPELLADKSERWAKQGYATFPKGIDIDSTMRVNERYLQEMVRFCHANHVRLIVVTLPQWRKETPMPEGYHERIASMGRRLAQESGVEYLDFLDDRRFTEDDFFDVSHLSDVGARKFTLILREHLLRQP